MLEHNDSGMQVLRRDAAHFNSNTSRIRFRCAVEVYEFERDVESDSDEDDATDSLDTREAGSSLLAMLSSCVAALCVTIFLPWMFIYG